MKTFPKNEAIFERFTQEIVGEDGKAHESILMLDQLTVLELVRRSIEGDMWARALVKGIVDWIDHAKYLSPGPLCVCCPELGQVFTDDGVNKAVRFVAIMPAKADATAAMIGCVYPSCSKKTDLEIARAISTLLHGGNPPYYVGMRGTH